MDNAPDENKLNWPYNWCNGLCVSWISKLFTSLQTHVLFSAGRSGKNTKFSLPKSQLYEVVDQKVLEHGRTADFQVKGYLLCQLMPAFCNEKALHVSLTLVLSGIAQGLH